MAPSKDKESTRPRRNNPSAEDERDEVDDSTQTDGDPTVQVNVLVNEEKIAGTRIVETILNTGLPANQRRHYYGPLSEQERVVSDRLLVIADAFNEQIEDALGSLRDIVPANPESKFNLFKRLAQRVISNGINWGRIATILILGARMLTSSGYEIADLVFTFLLEFITEKLFAWILDSGGWRSAIDYAEKICRHPVIPAVVNPTNIATVCAIAAVVGFIYYKYTSK
ncbi:bcl-2 homologous antagonist/killer-like isoform X1 [Clytia hemisphaerica]|uniref:Bcl-2 Bcl-2 homology region 1-3 domain-containing protein n=1 Tax=Clytia hemisphaerica TaxID=252671 RepID=A0A7M5XDT2_9CNID